jgi:hypothetical protein
MPVVEPKEGTLGDVPMRGFLEQPRCGTNFSPDVLLKLDVHVFPGL